MDQWNILKDRLEITFKDLELTIGDEELNSDRVYKLKDKSVSELVKHLVGETLQAHDDKRIDDYFPFNHRYKPKEPLTAEHENAKILWQAWTDFRAFWRPTPPTKW